MWFLTIIINRNEGLIKYRKALAGKEPFQNLEKGTDKMDQIKINRIDPDCLQLFDEMNAKWVQSWIKVKEISSKKRIRRLLKAK
jgi:hypothetical protein